MKYKTEALWKNFDNCCQYKHIRQVKNTIQPLAQEWVDKLKQFSKDNEDIKRIVSRFDEVILEKASKFSVDKIYEKLQDYATEEGLKESKDQVVKFECDLELKLEQITEDLYKKYTQLSGNFEQRIRESQSVIK